MKHLLLFVLISIIENQLNQIIGRKIENSSLFVVQFELKILMFCSFWDTLECPFCIFNHIEISSGVCRVCDLYALFIFLNLFGKQSHWRTFVIQLDIRELSISKMSDALSKDIHLCYLVLAAIIKVGEWWRIDHFLLIFFAQKIEVSYFLTYRC